LSPTTNTSAQKTTSATARITTGFTLNSWLPMEAPITSIMPALSMPTVFSTRPNTTMEASTQKIGFQWNLSTLPGSLAWTLIPVRAIHTPSSVSITPR